MRSGLAPTEPQNKQPDSHGHRELRGCNSRSPEILLRVKGYPVNVKVFIGMDEGIQG